MKPTTLFLVLVLLTACSPATAIPTNSPAPIPAETSIEIPTLVANDLTSAKKSAFQIGGYKHNTLTRPMTNEENKKYFDTLLAFWYGGRSSPQGDYPQKIPPFPSKTPFIAIGEGGCIFALEVGFDNYSAQDAHALWYEDLDRNWHRISIHP